MIKFAAHTYFTLFLNILALFQDPGKKDPMLLCLNSSITTILSFDEWKHTFYIHFKLEIFFFSTEKKGNIKIYVLCQTVITTITFLNCISTQYLSLVILPFLCKIVLLSVIEIIVNISTLMHLKKKQEKKLHFEIDFSSDSREKNFIVSMFVSRTFWKLIEALKNR